MKKILEISYIIFVAISLIILIYACVKLNAEIDTRMIELREIYNEIDMRMIELREIESMHDDIHEKLTQVEKMAKENREFIDGIQKSTGEFEGRMINNNRKAVSDELENILTWYDKLIRVRNMLNENRELFDKVKDIGKKVEFLFDGLRESSESPYTIFVYGKDEYVSIGEGSEYGPIVELFEKRYSIRSIGVNKYCLSFELYSWYWESIKYYYNNYGPDPNDGFVSIELSDNWYYVYKNEIMPPR